MKKKSYFVKNKIKISQKCVFRIKNVIYYVQMSSSFSRFKILGKVLAVREGNPSKQLKSNFLHIYAFQRTVDKAILDYDNNLGYM